MRALDIPAKTNGSAVYGIDVQVPGMVYATMLRSPVEGGAPEIIDDAETKKIPGVTQTVKLRDAVAIVGNTVEAVFAGRDALKVVWKGGATTGFNSEKALPEYAKRARTLDEKGLTYKSAGDTEAALQERRQGDRGRIPDRLCPSRADGADECHGLGQRGRRCRRNLDGHRRR